MGLSCDFFVGALEGVEFGLGFRAFAADRVWGLGGTARARAYSFEPSAREARKKTST